MAATRSVWAALATSLLLCACADTSRLAPAADFGPNPELPAPRKTLLPTVNIAPAVGWPEGRSPIAAEGTRVSAFATGLNHPRWIHVLPNGDVLVAESNAPPKPESSAGGIKAWLMKKAMAVAGAGVRSADRITLLRDADGDGVAEVRSVFLEHLTSPFGMALVGSTLYVANADALVSVPYAPGRMRVTDRPSKVLDLPAGINHHWTKNVIASPDGHKLYVTVGSNSNVAENGMGNEVGRAAIWEVEPTTGSHRLFATGLRNPNGLAWEPSTTTLWTVVNERDEIGSDLVPDFLTAVKDGAFYGWPYSYYGQHVDERVRPQRPDLVARAVIPDYALGAHTASLGLAFTDGSTLPFGRGMIIGQHGSWNRKPHSGYKVIFVPFAGARPSGPPKDVLSGFLSEDGHAMGRPVGVALDAQGALLVADDVGNVIWRVTAP